MLFIKLGLAIIPSIIIGLYIYKKDIVEKESKKVLTNLFIGGCCAASLTIIVTKIINTFFPSLIEPSNYMELIMHCFLVIALVEEGSKFFFIYLHIWSDKGFNFLYDAIVYCVFLALGFATIENILFVLQGDIVTALTRAITAVPGHACDAIFMGTYLGLAKAADVKNDIKAKKKYLLLSLIIPVILHGFYDFFILTQNLFFFFVFIIFIIIIYIIALKKINITSKIRNSFYE